MGTIEREAEVIDNLTSTSTIDALSANQGKVLNEKIKRYLKPVTRLSTASYTLTNCTGTVSIAPDIYVNEDTSVVWIYGRLRITNFARSSGNPGVTFKTNHAFPRYMGGAVIGTCFGSDGKIYPELMNVNFELNGNVSMWTTETTRNAPNGEYSCLFYGTPNIF